MPPAAALSNIKDLDISSLELDARSSILHKRSSEPVSLVSSSEAYHTITARDAPSILPDHGGAVDPTDINMKGIQALFALIGASFVVAIIWFFFWAKNGGFQWRKGDWDDYKSTVLRRKGPNGTTLSNATKSTRLGDGSVVGKGYSDGSGSTVDGTYTTETMTDMGSEAPVMQQQNRGRKETAKERKMREVKTAQFEGGHDEDVLAYIREKPARVGGINTDSEAFHYGTDYTDTEGSQIHNQQRTTRVSGPRGASTSRHASPEKRSSQQQQPQSQRYTSSRRDFSYGAEDSFSVVSSSYASETPAPPLNYPSIPVPQPAQRSDVPPPAPPHRPGRYHSPSKQFYPTNENARRSPQHSDVQSQNTKAYHHPLPSLSGHIAGQGQRQSPNPARGYRRDRRDSLDE